MAHIIIEQRFLDQANLRIDSSGIHEQLGYANIEDLEIAIEHIRQHGGVGMAMCKVSFSKEDAAGIINPNFSTDGLVAVSQRTTAGHRNTYQRGVGDIVVLFCPDFVDTQGGQALVMNTRNNALKLP